MTYAILQRYLGSKGRVEIDKADYDELDRSIQMLVEIVSAEEIYDGVVSSYAELEKEIVGVTIDVALFPNMEETQIRERKNTIARRIAMLLSAARMYVDTICIKANALADGGKDHIKDHLSAAYDTHLGYRVMEQLRNYSQHRGYPIEWISFGSTREDDEFDEVIWVHRTVLEFDIEDLISEDAFKAATRDELRDVVKQTGEPRMDIMPLIRQYVQCFSEVQAAFRAFCTDVESAAVATLQGAVDRYAAAFPENGKKFLCVGVIDEDGSLADFRNLYILDNPYRPLLRRKNPQLYHLSRNVYRS